MRDTHRSVILFGECMIELQRRAGSINQSFSGDVLNTATYMARLTQNQAVSIEFATAVGEDQFSNAMIDAWNDEAVGSKVVKSIPGRLPGLYFIENDKSGERHFYYWRNDSAAKHFFDDADNYLPILNQPDLKMFYLSGISLAILPPVGRQHLFDLLKQLKARGVTLVFDNNYRPILWSTVDDAQKTYHQMMELADIALLTWDDEQALHQFKDPDQLITQYAKYPVSELVIKRGAEPCILQFNETRYEIPAQRVDTVIDTTAAGDSFSAGYLAARLTGIAPQNAVRWGHRLAAEVVQHQGAIIPKNVMPKMPDDN